MNEKQALKELQNGYKKAAEILKNDKKVEDFLQQLEIKLKMIPKIGDELAIIPIMMSLVRSYARGEYTQIPVGTIIAIVSALIYFFSSFDIIPDAILGLGLLDDLSVLGICLKLIKSDVNDYLEWREEFEKNKKEKIMVAPKKKIITPAQAIALPKDIKLYDF